MSKEIPIDALIESELGKINGLSSRAIHKITNVPAKAIAAVQGRVSEVMASNSPELAFERQIISEAITDRLKPLKEELALKSLEIVRVADDLLLDELNSGMMKTKDVIRVSDSHSKRLARIVGLEEDPGAGGGDPNEANKTVNIYIKNMFSGHKKKLEEERNSVNDISLTPIYEADVEPA